MENELKLKGDKNPKIKSKNDDEVLKFYMGKNELDDPEEFESFIKACELMIHKDPRYKNYVSHLKECGFNRCTMMSGITDDMARIDMHHGPLFTLYDICSIVVDHMLYEGEKVSTFDIANIVLREHEEHNVQVVMLTRTSHELTGAGRIFVHYKQAFGNIMKFIKNFKKGIRREHLYTMEKYIDLCEQNDATDNDLLKVVGKIEKFTKK